MPHGPDGSLSSSQADVELPAGGFHDVGEENLQVLCVWIETERGQSEDDEAVFGG